MAGIYIHIPFCKTRCIYCDFYSTTRSELKSQYIRALCRELTERKEYLKGEAVETIYFGGGTPSQLSEEDFKEVFKTIEQVYGMREATEITLEANPDDLTEEYIGMLHTLPFNRISMGIQTFDDATLQLLNRRHNATQAIEAVKHCRQAGFQNISIDLIYGLPGETEQRWAQDLQQAVSLDVEHISAYHLIYEEGTPLYKMLQQHSVSQVDEDSSLNFFSTLIDTLSAAGYEHYEISNFCKPGMYSDPDFTAKLYMCGVRFMKGLQASRIYHFETKSTTRIRKNCGQMQFLLKWGMTSSTFRKVFTYKGKDFKSQKIGTFKTGNRFKISLIRGRLKAIFYLLTKDFGPLWKFWKKTFV